MKAAVMPGFCTKAHHGGPAISPSITTRLPPPPLRQSSATPARSLVLELAPYVVVVSRARLRVGGGEAEGGAVSVGINELKINSETATVAVIQDGFALSYA